MTTRTPDETPSRADRKRILVVVDHAPTCSFLEQILEARYRVETVHDGPAARDAIGRQAPDLVLTARVKPPLDGLALLRELRQKATTPRIPVVLLSEPEEEDFRTEGLQLGADDHLTRPFGAGEVLARVAYHLNASRLRLEADLREQALGARSAEDRKALQESDARFRSLVRQSRDGIVIVDGHGTIVEWNEGEEQLTGISRAEAVQRPIWEVQLRLAPEGNTSPDHLRVAREKTLAGLREGTGLRRRLEDEIQRPDGGRRTIESFLFAFQSGGELFAVAISRDITERTRSERRLRTSEERLSLAVEASSLGLWDWDLAADTAYLSPEYLRFSGYDDSPIRSAFEFFRGLVHPADLPTVERTLSDHLAGKTPRSAIEYRMRKKSGEYSWVRGVGRVTARDDNGAPARMTGTIEDISESKRLEEELRERQALLLEAERLAHLGHWDRDLRSGRSFWSSEVFRVLGCSEAVVPSRDAFVRAVHPEDRDRIAEAIAATARDGMTRRGEYRVVDVHGAVRSLQGTVELLRDSSGAPARLIGTVQDITERKAAEVERERLLEALRAADRNKNEFLAMLSHELRNPLAPITNSLYVLDRAEPGGDQGHRALAVINRQVGQLARLVDDLLDVTRISKDKIVLHRQQLELTELVRHTMEDHRSLFEKNELRLELVPAERPVFVNADWNRLAQVVGSLLSNAVKFTGKGGRTTVSVLSDQASGKAIIRVGDTGVGMTPETLSRIFQPFMQADTALDRARGGLGLGLALAKGLVELHGGQVTASSAGLGQGAELVVQLPLAAPPPLEAPRPFRGSGAGVRRRVLIIEDNIDAAESLREALEFSHHDVAVAYDGPGGIEKAREFRPDVVLCDIGLPGMDGYQVARTLRTSEGLRDIFLVALSGYALPADLQRAQDAGFDRHVAKPPSLEELEALLEDVPERPTEPLRADAPPPRELRH